MNKEEIAMNEYPWHDLHTYKNKKPKKAKSSGEKAICRKQTDLKYTHSHTQKKLKLLNSSCCIIGIHSTHF